MDYDFDRTLLVHLFGLVPESFDAIIEDYDPGATVPD